MNLSCFFTSVISAVNVDESDKSQIRVDFEDESLLPEQESKT